MITFLWSRIQFQSERRWRAAQSHQSSTGWSRLRSAEALLSAQLFSVSCFPRSFLSLSLSFKAQALYSCEVLSGGCLLWADSHSSSVRTRHNHTSVFPDFHSWCTWWSVSHLCPTFYGFHIHAAASEGLNGLSCSAGMLDQESSPTCETLQSSTETLVQIMLLPPTGELL